MSVDRDERQRHLPAGRKAQLAAYVADTGQVTVGELAERFGVSIDTVRRDLDQLAAEGILVRTYGGAVSLSTVSRTDRAVDQRLTVQEQEKEKIAALAATLVQDGSTIMINGGTTTLALARNLGQHRDLTVATNNLLVPGALPPTAIRDIYMFGGAARMMRHPAADLWWSAKHHNHGGNVRSSPHPTAGRSKPPTCGRPRTRHHRSTAAHRDPARPRRRPALARRPRLRRLPVADRARYARVDPIKPI